jgi:hypothetical protein
MGRFRKLETSRLNDHHPQLVISATGDSDRSTQGLELPEPLLCHACAVHHHLQVCRTSLGVWAVGSGMAPCQIPCVPSHVCSWCIEPSIFFSASIRTPWKVRRLSNKAHRSRVVKGPRDLSKLYPFPRPTADGLHGPPE